MAADIRIARKDSGKVGLPEVALGVLPGTGGTQRLVRLVGKPAAIQMMAEGTTFGFDEAHKFGLVNEIYDNEDRDFADAQGVRVIPIEEFFVRGVADVMAEAREIVGSRSTYVSFDIDFVDPAFAPGTGTPEVGGFTTLEAQMMLRGLSGLNLVGGDIFHGALHLDQFYSLRPLPGHADYKMPVDGVFLCGSGAHPGGGVSGLPGRNAAQAILRQHN